MRLVAVSFAAIPRGEEDRVREHSSKLGIPKPDGPDGKSLGAPEEWANITMWLLYSSFARA